MASSGSYTEAEALPVAGPRVEPRARRWPTQQIVLGLTAAATLILVGYPLLWLLLGSLGIPRTLSLAAFASIVTNAAYSQALLNTVVLALATGLGSVLFGVPLAWATARTDLPGKGLLRVAAAMAYMLPPYLTAIAYIILAGPNSGQLNRFVTALTGAERGPFNIFTLAGVAFVISLHVFPITYFLTHAALLSVDSGLEQSAQILGASRLRTLRRITLPLVAPAITAGFLLAGVNSMALFGPQAFLGNPGRVDFLPTRVYALLQRFPPNFAEASALSFALVSLTVLGLYAQRAFLERKSYVTVAGKAGRSEPVRLGAWTVPVLLLCWGVALFAVILPLGILAMAAFSKNWLEPFLPGNWTLGNFSYALFEEQVSRRGLVNSLGLAAGAATLSILLGLVIAYFDLRTQVRGRRLLDYLAILPLGLPGIVLSVGLLQGWIRIPLPVYATIWILLIAYTARFIPLAVRSANTSLRQVDPSLEEAARVVGAGWVQALRRVTAPLIRPGLLVGWILVFVPAMAELSATVLLYTQGTETLSIAVFRLHELGRLEVVAAIAVVQIAITLTALAVAVRIAGRGIDLAGGGGT
jgi:iron(III) transport system permease protein